MAGSTNAPYGFRLIGTMHGGEAMTKTYYCDGGGATAIYNGDAVSVDSSGERVLVSVADDGVIVAGICIGTYSSTMVPTQYLAGSTTGYVDVCSDPQAIFNAQVSGYRTGSTGLAETYCNDNVNHVAGTGSTLTGLSAHTLDATAPVTTTAQFRIIGLADIPNNAWGDRYVELQVIWNEHTFNQTTGAGS